MSFLLYTFEFALIDFVGLRHALHLEREGYAKVIRHRKGYRRACDPRRPTTVRDNVGQGLFVCATARRRTSRVEAPATPGRQLRLDAGARRHAPDLPGGRAGLLGAGGETASRTHGNPYSTSAGSNRSNSGPGLSVTSLRIASTTARTIRSRDREAVSWERARAAPQRMAGGTRVHGAGRARVWPQIRMVGIPAWRALPT
jgi:hypothetical protein